MKLDEYISEYRRLKIITEIIELNTPGRIKTEQEVINLLNRISMELPILIKQPTKDFFSACLMFTEMYMRKIKGDLIPIIAYYYGTLAISQSSIPDNSRIDARRLRLFAIFNNLDSFENYITFAQAPLSGYNGTLNSAEFFDFLIMSDAYLVWDSDNSSNILKSIQRLTIKHEPNHPQYNRELIILEGGKAHEALFNVVSMAVVGK